MLKKAMALGVVAGVLTTTGFAQADHAPTGIPRLDYVFLIMMENHGYQQVFGNPNEPYLNSLIASGKVNLAGNYWAVGHPSLTNYLEIVGGSNFGILDDNWRVWPNGGCVDNNPSGSGCGGAYSPLQGSGMDYSFPATVDACLAPWFNQ